MRGPIKVDVRDRRVRYELDLERSITVVRGDSGTGKTTLFELIRDAESDPDSGITISCDHPCVALSNYDWQARLSKTKDSVVFVDEGLKGIGGNEFASLAKKTGNFFVIFNREPLFNLPYSVNAIYQMKTSGKKLHKLEPVYRPNSKHLYDPSQSRTNEDYTVVLVEDKKSGFEFYSARFMDSTNLTCESAGSKTKIYSWLMKHETGRVFVIADGAAFGPEAERVLKLQSQFPDRLSVCLPESFEWLLLKALFANNKMVASALESTPQHVDSKQYLSWEQYFTRLLMDVSGEIRGMRYRKSKLAKAYLSPANADKVMRLIATRNIK